MKMKNVLIIGISGVTCGGKTTLASALKNMLPHSISISQDDYFRSEDDPQQTYIPELDHKNYELMSSLRMDDMQKDILKAIGKRPSIKKPNEIDYSCMHNYNEITALLHKKLKESETQIIIVEGFSIYNFKPFLPLFDIKYYFTLDKEECHKRRLLRTYEPPDCPGYFERCIWPEHLKQLKEVKEEVKDVTYFKGTDETPLRDVLHEIMTYL